MVGFGERICPDCGGKIFWFDSCKRVCRRGYGRKDILKVSRFKCENCGRIHRETPKNMMPFKQYDKRIIEGFLSGQLSTCSDAFEDYPTDLTVRIWKRMKNSL